MCRSGILLVVNVVLLVLGTSVMTLMISIVHTLGQDGSGFRMQLGKTTISAALLHIVWVVTFGTDKPAFFAIGGPLAYAFTVHTATPVPIGGAVAFAAEFLRLVKADFIAKIVDQFIARLIVVAIQAPQSTPAVLQVKGVGNDILVHGECAGVFIFRDRRESAVMTGHTAKWH